MFTTKAHLLSEVREISTLKELIEFAKQVEVDPLNRVSILTQGTFDQILASLMDAPKSVLEDAFIECFDDNNPDDEDNGDLEEENEDHETEFDDEEE